jgi:lysophospholipase L1-like esterase
MRDGSTLMTSVRARFLLAASSAAAAALAAWGLFALRRPAGDPVRFADDADSAQELLVERQGAIEGGGGALTGPAAKLLDGPLVRETLSEEDVKRLFPRPSDLFEYDPYTFYRYKGHLAVRVDFADYPGGFFIKRTSAEGFDEDFDHLPDQRDLLVIVTGDSHTDGMCANRESFANRVESALVDRHPGMAIEVLNTGATGYSFYNYLGVLEKLAGLKPQAFVVAFYGGNDFVDLIKPWHYYHHTALPPRRPEYWKKLDRVKSESGGALANALHQILYFHYNPEEVENALAGAAQACLEIQRRCSEQGIRLFFVHIPVAFRVGGEAHPSITRAKELLDLSDYDLHLVHRLADRLIEVLRQRGVEVIDLRDHFTGDIGRYYWSDLHINLEGQKVIAELLLPRIEAACLAGRR